MHVCTCVQNVINRSAHPSENKEQLSFVWVIVKQTGVTCSNYRDEP